MAQQSMSAFTSSVADDDAQRARVQAHTRSWKKPFTPAIGKCVYGLAHVRGGGSAFPGEVVEKLDPGFLARTLSNLPLGTVVVSGTNGKTTSTRMVVSLLESLGLKVFTNPTGSNFVRGVISSLLPQISLSGKLDADIAVLELDEAYSVKFVQQVQPRYTLLLNVMRDQLDRFGEIDTTARLLAHAAHATSGTLILNREDPLISSLAKQVREGTKVSYYGLGSDNLRKLFPNDAQLHSSTLHAIEKLSGTAMPVDQQAEESREEEWQRAASLPADVLLTGVETGFASLSMDGTVRRTSMRVSGVYNMFNAAGALVVARAVVADASRVVNGEAAGAAVASGADAGAKAAAADHATLSPAQRERLEKASQLSTTQLIDALSAVTPAFGRGETVMVNNVPVELVLVKNPGGFRLALHSFPAQGTSTMIAINDEYADGRDMSWLWDVDFASLVATGVSEVTGVRAWDMATRLAYDGVEVQETQTDLHEALTAFLQREPHQPKRIYCTYTAMLALRQELSQIATIENVGVRA